MYPGAYKPLRRRVADRYLEVGMKILGVILVVVGIPATLLSGIPGLVCIGVGALCIMAGKG